MFLNRELLRWGPLRLLNHREMRRRAAVALAEIGVDVPSVELEVGALSGGQRQAIAVARAVYSKARILLLDEPLAAMGAREARLIIGLIERLRARGDIAIVMIAHNYAQTLEICDRVLLMQHGEITFESQAAATSAEELLEIVRREGQRIRLAVAGPHGEVRDLLRREGFADLVGGRRAHHDARVHPRVHPHRGGERRGDEGQCQRAGSILAWPAISPPSSPTSAGVVQPHSLMLAAIAATWASVWVRAFLA